MGGLFLTGINGEKNTKILSYNKTITLWFDYVSSSLSSMFKSTDHA